LIEVERFPDVVKSALDEWIYDGATTLWISAAG
jgi:hypothetical protein